MSGMPPVLDRAQLDALGDDLGDVEFLRETVELYLGELPTRRSAMLEAFEVSDRTAVRERAHSLGSASAMLGAAELAAACRAIEHAAAGAQPAELAALRTQWTGACDRTAAALRQWLAPNASADQGSNR